MSKQNAEKDGPKKSGSASFPTGTHVTKPCPLLSMAGRRARSRRNERGRKDLSKLGQENRQSEWCERQPVFPHQQRISQLQGRWCSNVPALPDLSQKASVSRHPQLTVHILVQLTQGWC